MSHDTGDLPTPAWELSAPASYVLLHGHRNAGAGALKAGLVELVARRTLELRNVEESKRLGRKKRTAVLTRGSGSEALTSRPLQALLDLYSQAQSRTFADGTTGVPVAELARQAQKRYKPLNRYVEEEVLPELETRGLYEKVQKKRLGLFASTQHALTPAGQEAKRKLEGMQSQATSEFPNWVREDPPRAARFAALAGPAVFLMPEIYPELGRLHSQAAMGDAGAHALDTPDTESGAELEEVYSELDISGLDFSAFDGLDSAFDTIDSGFSEAGGDGGSDGGSDGGGGSD